MSTPAMSLTCQNSTCEAEATTVMALPSKIVAPSVYVSPYCSEHAAEVKGMGGFFAAGPALSEPAREIEGIRR